MNERRRQLRKKPIFAFETNYHTSEVMKTVEDFKSEGYRSELVFIFLKNIAAAKKRVKDRVARGGHSVWEETIEERFTLGLALLDVTFRRYDFVSLYLSQENKIVAIGNIGPSKKSCTLLSELPQSLLSSLPNLTKFFSKYS